MDKPTRQALLTGRWPLIFAVTLMVCTLVLLDAYRHFHDANRGGREGLLRHLPSDADAALFIDFQELRGSPFSAEVYKWIPKFQVDPEYTQFVHDTGFDYERDLRRVAIAWVGSENSSFFVAIAEGNFDRQRMQNYATRIGRRDRRGDFDVFSLPAGEKLRAIWFAFLEADRILVTDSPDMVKFASPQIENSDSREWATRFARLAGSPIFAVIRQSATTINALASQAPGGFQSPQFSTLLAQLQWITVAGKPEGANLKIVAEGETVSEQTVRQLGDLLNGVLLLAQAGLNGPEIRRQLDPRLRDAYLELARGAEVSRIDRGETKSLRLVIEITPKFLEVAGSGLPSRPPVEQPGPGNTTPTKGSRSRPK